MKENWCYVFIGTKPIDGVWVTSGVVIIRACVMTAGYGIEDHRIFVLDLLTSSLIGHDPPKRVRAAARRLNTNTPSGELYYINRLEELITNHKIVEKVGQAHDKSTSKASLKINLDKIDASSYNWIVCNAGWLQLEPDH